MSARWMFMILVGYRLSQATLSQSTCTCNDQLKTACVRAGDNVSVPCPELTGEHITFHLLKNGEIYHMCSHERNAPNCKPPYTSMGVELHENTNSSASFMLTGVNASSYGIYRCEGSIIYPPPFKKEANDLTILVLVEGLQCKINKDCDKPVGDQNSWFPWVWTLPLALVSIYSAIVTIIALVNWVKWRNTESQSDYMNTKPRAPRKKRGVQNPIPRHF